jgi:hypothetical protein
MVDIKNLKKFIMQQFVGQVIPIVNHSIWEEVFSDIRSGEMFSKFKVMSSCYRCVEFK